MPSITRASGQLENFTITKHNTHYTKRQLISHQHQHQHQHTPTPTDKIKPKSQNQGKILIKLKTSANHSSKESDKVSLKE